VDRFVLESDKCNFDFTIEEVKDIPYLASSVLEHGSAKFP
jgi:hypothetical protein